MEKEKQYRQVRFSADIIKTAAQKLDGTVTKAEKEDVHLYMWADLGEESWNHDSESEFFADYRRSPERAGYSRSHTSRNALRVQIWEDSTVVTVTAPKREDIEAVFDVFEQAVEDSRLPEPAPEPEKKPVIFIGHGHNTQWRELKDHLRDKHHFNITAYEVGARAGHSVRDILEQMLTESSLALLVHTAEDESVTGKMQARQNVVHETELFQGRLGFHRGIVLLEEGTDEFSNIHGIEQIRFKAYPAISGEINIL